MTKIQKLFTGFLFCFGTYIGILLWEAAGREAAGAQQQTPPTTYTMYTLVRQRDDFTATTTEGIFKTSIPPRSRYVEVFRNGELMRAGPANDYVGADIPGAYRITFNFPIDAGDNVTLFYYR